MKKIFLIFMLFMIQKVYSIKVDITPNTKTVNLYEKFEVTINCDLKLKNPYDYDEISITGNFISPDGSKKEVDAFYYEDFEIKENKGFKIRFTPDKSGKWKYFININLNKKQIYTSKEYSFNCKKEKHSNGFIRISPTDFLFMEFSDKEPFFAKGLNLAWSVEDVLYNYEKWILKIKENGGNFIRLWMANWFLGIEWDYKLKDYGRRQKQAFLLDKIFELCEKEKIYILLCLIPHGEFSTVYNSNWEQNPYNLKNGGIIKSPDEFFFDERAKSIFKNRLRYIIARYSYSTSLFAWELINEADLTDNYNPEIILKWHKEMISELKKRDIYKHLKTTSFSDPYKEDVIWELKDIDFTQTHIYGTIDGAEEIYEISKYKIEKFQKPHIVSEFGIDVSKEQIEKGIDKEGVHFHNSIWSGVFTLSFGWPMIWWWDIYIDKFNLWSYFKPLSQFIKDIKWSKGGYYELKDRDVLIDKADENSFRDLIIYPIPRWGKTQINKFVIKNNGFISNKIWFPAYLYGKSKENIRDDIIIRLTNEKPGKMVIKIKKVSHNNILTVYVNEAKVLSENINAQDFQNKKFFQEWNIYQADIEKEVSIDLIQGDNEIILKNEGEDWLLIEYVKFTEIIKNKYANVFVSGIQNNKEVYAYIKNRDFKWNNKNVNKIKNTILNIYDLLSGRYIIQFYDTFTGNLIKETQDIVDNDILLIEIPEFEKDIAFKIRRYSE